jgi:hypothetical protein
MIEIGKKNNRFMSLLDMFKYPPVGFHFAVVIELFPQTPQDFVFRV